MAYIVCIFTDGVVRATVLSLDPRVLICQKLIYANYLGDFHWHTGLTVGLHFQLMPRV